MKITREQKDNGVTLKGSIKALRKKKRKRTVPENWVQHLWRGVRQAWNQSYAKDKVIAAVAKVWNLLREGNAGNKTPACTPGERDGSSTTADWSITENACDRQQGSDSHLWAGEHSSQHIQRSSQECMKECETRWYRKIFLHEQVSTKSWQQVKKQKSAGNYTRFHCYDPISQAGFYLSTTKKRS